jgi:hypothetical protein
LFKPIFGTEEMFMSRNPETLSKVEEAAVGLVTLPFMVASATCSIVKRGYARIIGTTKAASPPAVQYPVVASAVPAVTPIPKLTIADRVFSASIRGQQVSFFHYYEAKVIRISTRANRRVLEALFTPDLADASNTAFDIDGAIEWIRKRGFTDQQPAPTPAAKAPESVTKAADTRQPQSSTPVAAESTPARPSGDLGKGSTKANSAPVTAVSEKRLEYVTGGKNRAFRGRIERFGQEKRKATRPGEKDYMTYVVALASETGAYTKEFIGEHLADLVEQHQLEVGRLVTIQLIAKEFFQVEVAGKLEDRCRNHYSVELH